MKNKYPSIVPCSRPLQFQIGRDSRGNWIVQDDQGLCGGLFIDRTQALRFARERKPSASCGYGSRRV
jgi:hypothetical protein